MLLPELNCIYFEKNGVKNRVTQLLAPKANANLAFVRKANDYAVFEDNGVEICITPNKDLDLESFEYAILSNKKVTERNYLNDGFTLKRWLKRPKNQRHTNQSVISSWANSFNFAEEDVAGNIAGLREPQIAALYSILSHLKVTNGIGTVVMPTGTGKTETMISALVAGKLSKTLIIVPSDALRNQIANKFYDLGLLKKFKLVGSDALFPKIGVIYHNFNDQADLIDFIDSSNVVITTMNILANNSTTTLSLLNRKFTNVFIDEAHHVEAHSWKMVRESFDNQKIIQFTATPFRSDRKRLDGNVIFNFSLRKAQEQGYFKPINFIPIREYDLVKGDKVIADKAVEKLREDLSNGFNHILMARCENKARAENVFELYKTHEDLKPVLVHSSIVDKKEILRRITSGECKIIVAVNMLGEGFDLPQLKIAAFHDIRKSLPITLQFAGRFTRTAFDNKLGNATFVANLASADTENELSELYAQDSDWNSLLSTLSASNIEDQIDFNEFMNGFQNLDSSRIPFQNIRFALSTVVYKNQSADNSFDIMKFNIGIPEYENLDYKFHDYNPRENTLVVITAAKSEVEWVNYKDIVGLDWELIVVYYDADQKLLFIHSSDKSSLYGDLARAILNGSAQLIDKRSVFKCFHGIQRLSLQNVGLKEFLNRRVRFTMKVGVDIQEALSIAEQQKGEKAFVFGAGYENGEKTTLGSSYKGRIWSYLRSDLKGFVEWCKNVGQKLVDENIDANQVLRDTLIPKDIAEIPRVFPTHIDWGESFHDIPESKVWISINEKFNLSDCAIDLIDPSDNGEIKFELSTPGGSAKFKFELFETEEDGKKIPDFRITKLDVFQSQITIGTKTSNLQEYLNEYPPIVWFADGSALQGTEYVQLKQVFPCYPKDRLISWDWTGVDLGKESQGVNPLHTDSIQYKVIQELLSSDYDIIYDDDYAGEIADVITVKETSEVV